MAILRTKISRVPVALAACALLFCLPSCATFSRQAEPVRAGYASGNFKGAEQVVDERIAKETGVDLNKLQDEKFLVSDVDFSEGDALVYLLDKSILRLAQDDPATSVKLLRIARDQLDANYTNDTEGYLRDFTSLLTDDSVQKYKGADYDHLLVRVFAALADLVDGGGDAYAYASQIGEKQEELINSPLGEINGDTSLRPREKYRRLSVGAYMQGMIREDRFNFDEAGRAYERALAFDGWSGLYQTALDRVKEGQPYSQTGNGVLHVFYLAGRGPYLEETRHNPTSEAVRIAGFIMLFQRKGWATLAQAPVPVPFVVVNDLNPPPIRISGGGSEALTQTVLDVNEVMQNQLKANLPWIVAKALVRRAAKAVAGEALGSVAGKAAKDDAVGGLLKIAVNAVSTAVENADTRSWNTLPAQIQSARIELPAGENDVSLGPGAKVKIRISPGKPSYAVIFAPSPDLPPTVVVDRYSRPLE